MFSFDDLKELFLPGIGHVVRIPNRLKKGFLKKSMFPRMKGHSEHKQGDREKARRLRQIEAGISRRS